MTRRVEAHQQLNIFLSQQRKLRADGAHVAAAATRDRAAPAPRDFLMQENTGFKVIGAQSCERRSLQGAGGAALSVNPSGFSPGVTEAQTKAVLFSVIH